MEQVSKKDQVMKKYHEVEKIAFVKETLNFIVDGKEYTFPLADISKKLADAPQVEREKYEKRI